VRRLIGWTAGIVGIAALARLLAHRRPRHAPAPASAAQPPVDDHAVALRRKLEATRAAEEREATATPEPAAKESLEKRRARVHAKAQEAIEAMHEEPLA
jgi:hypothetical protein